MQNKRRGVVRYATLKMDISKAYDLVEWSFLEKMMEKMRFHERWMQLTMKCITTVSYHIKVNTPSRGLCQEDPLSSYLFLLCVEGFPTLLNIAEESGVLEGMIICNNVPSNSLIVC